MGNLAVHAQGLGKRYRLGQTKRTGWGHQPSNDEFWALRDVSFDIGHGEVVGIIGGNGAGKSTLLKILSRITEPTEGYADIHGRVGSLLEVGTGFHPELTGRENIYLNGSILGMRRAEIQRRFDEIVDFAEIERFIDTPVKHYSSGMYVRLAFAVAAHLEPEILVVDEVLAVGDAAFQKKCLGKMGDVATQGRTVLFVSHNVGAILQLCSRGIVMEGGRRTLDSDASTAVAAYLGQDQSRDNAAVFDIELGKDVQIVSMSVVAPDGRAIRACPHTQPFCIVIHYRITQWQSGSYVCLDVINEQDVHVLWSSDVDSVDDMLVGRPPGMYEAIITIPEMVLSPGNYTFTAAILAPRRGHAFDARERAISVEITDGGSLLSNFGVRTPAATMIPLGWKTGQLEDQAGRERVRAEGIRR